MEMRRFVLLGAGVALFVSACGGGEVSLSEYAEELTTLMEEAIEQGEELTLGGTGAVLVAEGAQLDEFTPKDLQAALERVKGMEQQIRAGADAIEPPEALADLHRLMFDTRFAMALDAAIIPTAARETRIACTDPFVRDVLDCMAMPGSCGDFLAITGFWKDVSGGPVRSRSPWAADLGSAVRQMGLRTSLSLLRAVIRPVGTRFTIIFSFGNPKIRAI